MQLGAACIGEPSIVPPSAVVTIGNTLQSLGGVGGNLISGNAGYGVKVEAGNGHLIKGNHIGTNKNVNAGVANDMGGILISGGSSTAIG